jgi:1A family penicillin-binding protein
MAALCRHKPRSKGTARAYNKKVSSWGQKPRRRLRKPRKTTFGRVLAYIALGVLALILIGLAAFAVILYTIPVPAAKDLTFTFSESSQIVDRNGTLIATYSPDEKRVYKPLSEISPLLQNALIAVEDHRFYEHSGIDTNGIARAVWDYVTTGEVQGGGSTLTQQLAREAYKLSKEVSVMRKIKEIMLAFRIEQAYSKEQILELYLNAVYFGQNAYGAEAAALTYFGKHASEVNLVESAWLAGVINAPSVLGAPENREAAKQRQELVLDRMKTYRFITEGEFDQAMSADLNFSETAIKLESDAPYFVTWVKGILEGSFDGEVLKKGGLTVETTLDLRMQRWATEAMSEAYKYWTDEKGLLDPSWQYEGVSQPQGALVALDPKTGGILAMSGGRDWNQTEVNRTLRARPPGSSFKIFDYSAAIDKKIVTPATKLVSEAIDVSGWKPTEYTGDFEPGSQFFYGEMSVRDAIKKSSNVIAVKVALQVGLENVIEYAHKMGIQSELQPYPSVAIGSMAVTPLEMAQAYAVLANMGNAVEANPILKITNREGTVLEDNTTPKLTPVLSPATCYIMTDLFKGVYQNTGYAYIDDYIAAGKTGTTDYFLDAWFCGYTPNIVVVTRNGHDYDELIQDFQYKNIGAWIPATIWYDFMVKVAEVEPSEDWPMPTGVIRKDGEVFLVGTENMATKTPTTPTVNITVTPSWIATQTPSWLFPTPSPPPSPMPSTPSPHPHPTPTPTKSHLPKFPPKGPPTTTPTPKPKPSPTPSPTPTRPPITETPSWLLPRTP